MPVPFVSAFSENACVGRRPRQIHRHDRRYNKFAYAVAQEKFPVTQDDEYFSVEARVTRAVVLALGVV